MSFQVIKYDYLWRLDADIEVRLGIPCDVFDIMVKSHAVLVIARMHICAHKSLPTHTHTHTQIARILGPRILRRRFLFVYLFVCMFLSLYVQVYIQRGIYIRAVHFDTRVL